MRIHPEDIKEIEQKRKKPGVVIVGNMNVGKSSLFSRMCGSKTTSINVAGSTVSIASGNIKGTGRKVFDTPGILSIFSDNEDERASREILLSTGYKRAPAFRAATARRNYPGPAPGGYC